MLKVFLLLALPGMLAGGLAVGTQALVGSDPPPTQWVVWGGKAHSNPGELAEWLAARGLSYKTWAERHPAAAARLEGRPPPQPEPQVTTVVVPEPAPAPETAAPQPAREAAPPGTSSDGIGPLLLTTAILVLALGLMLLASVPPLLLQRFGVPLAVGERRPEIAAVGISLAIGLGAAHLL